MASKPINEASILATFDSLRSREIIAYDPNQRLVAYSSKNFHAFFIITSAMEQKPSFPSDDAAASESELMPGSDIDYHGYEIGNIGTSHILAFSKFSVFRPHLLLLTSNGWRRQHEVLDSEDFGALWDVMARVGENWIGIFNCGKEGGCSRLHKHLQLFRLPDHEEFMLFPDRDGDTRHLPFKCFLHRFEKTATCEDIFTVYERLLQEVRSILGIGNEANCPHNFVLNLSKGWIVVIPRRKADVDGLGVNAVGMMGIMPMKGQEDYEKWLAIEPEKVLAETGIPPNPDGGR